MKKIALIGSEELAAQLLYYINSTDFGEVCAFFDDYESPNKKKYGIPVLGTPLEVPNFFKQAAFDSVFIAVGYNHRKYRMEIYDFLKKNNVTLDTFIHPSALVDVTSSIGQGSIVLMNTVIDMHCQIQENVFIAPGCLISHNVTIGSHSYIAPGTCIAGNVQIGTCCFCGVRTTCIDKIQIGSNVVCAAGSVITQNILDNSLVAGVPAKIKRTIPFD